MEADFAQVEQYKNELVGYMQDLPLEQGQSLALLYLYNLYYEMGFYDMQVAYKLGLDHRLYQRLRAIETQRDLVIYFTSVLRRIMEYFELLKSQALILLLICLFTTLLTFFATVLTVQGVQKLIRRGN